MNDLRLEIAEALAAPPTASKCIELLNKVATRQGEVVARKEALAPVGKFGNPAGPERQKALLTGTADAVRAVDNEYADLVLESEQLETQRLALQARREDAKAKEAAEGLPAMLSDLEKRMKALESTRDKLNAQLAEFDQIYQEAVTARAIASRSGHHAATGKASLAKRIRDFAPWASNVRTRVFGRHATPEEDLGITEPHDHLRQIA